MVPTGSMAPDAAGPSSRPDLPELRHSLRLRRRREGPFRPPGLPELRPGSSWNRPRRRWQRRPVLVQKFLYDFRPPRPLGGRRLPEPGRPHPGLREAGGGLCRASRSRSAGATFTSTAGSPERRLEEQRATRILVYSNDFLPADADRFPRWIARKEGGSRAQSGWRPPDPASCREPSDSDNGRTDWLEYRHWQPDRKAPGPVRDFIAYNGAESGSENRVDDLSLDADGERRARLPDLARADSLTAQIGSRPRFRSMAARRRESSGMGETCDDRRGPGPAWNPRTPSHPGFIASRPRSSTSNSWSRLTASWPSSRFGSTTRPRARSRRRNVVAIGLQGGSGEIRGLQVYRDVYYTSVLSNALRRPFAVGEPYRLGAGEYFVLGDNSPVSNDSRFWSISPVVREEMFLGKPFLVHLPSQAVPLQVFGQAVYWIPDPRQIRYIR